MTKYKATRRLKYVYSQIEKIFILNPQLTFAIVVYTTKISNINNSFILKKYRYYPYKISFGSK